jgi:thiol-disulfide isomerase/thioredoxin
MALKLILRAVTVLLVLCLVVLGVLVYQVFGPERGASPALASSDASAGVTPADTAIGKFTPLDTPLPAPEVSFTDHSGATVRLADFRGHAVLVNLWATWCGPCVKEMPSLARLQAKLGDLTVLAISEDRRGAELVDPFLAKLAITGLATYLDPKSAVGHAFGVVGLPTSFLIDRDGRILGALEGGAEWDAPAMVRRLRLLIGGEPIPIEKTEAAGSAG